MGTRMGWDKGQEREPGQGERAWKRGLIDTSECGEIKKAAREAIAECKTDALTAFLCFL